MPENDHTPAGPAEDLTFSVDMDPAALYKATRELSPGDRVHFWSTFQSTVNAPYPAVITGRIVDDVAAVFSGAKPATILSPEELSEPQVHQLIIEEDDRANTLVKTYAVDYYGGVKVFWGKKENVSTLAELYAGRGGDDSPRPADESFHRAVGEALGYSQDAVDAFVERVSAPEASRRQKGRLGGFLGRIGLKR